MELTEAQAKKKSLIRWDDRRKSKDGRGDFNHGCGYCQKYACPQCPLAILWKKFCCKKRTPYYKWAHAKTNETCKKYAERVYQDIKRS